MKQKALALALVLCMVIAMLPVSVFAAPAKQTAQIQAQPQIQAVPEALPELPAQPDAGKYKITAKVTKGSSYGEIELSASSADAGDKVYLMANPDDGYLVELGGSYEYHYYEMEVIYIGMDLYEITMPDGKVELEVKFVAAPGSNHKVNLTVNNSAYGVAEASRTQAKEGESILVAAQAADGYYLDNITAVDANGEGAMGAYLGMDEDGIEYFEIIMPATALYIDVIFEKTVPHYITIDLGIPPCGKAWVDNDYLYPGEEFILTVEPGLGYEVNVIDPRCNGEYVPVTWMSKTQWKGVMPNGDLHISISMKSVYYRVSAYVVGNVGGGAYVRTSSVIPGHKAEVRFRPDEGYKVASITGADDITYAGDDIYTFIMPEHNVTLAVTYKLRNNPINLTVGSHGTATVSHTEAEEGEIVTITCSPDEGYKIDKITGADSLQDNGDGTFSFVMPDRAVDLTVTFKERYHAVTAEVETGLGGTVALSHDKAEEGDTVTLAVTPEEGYRVAQITGVKDLQDNGDGTYTFTMPDEAVELKVLFLRHENPFLDVNETHFFYDPVLWAVKEGITSGMTENTFGPFAVCNRAQVVTFLWRYAGSPEPATTENPFTDVPAESWFTKPVLWALENGITQGVSATEFGPELACNRAQVVTFLWRLMQEPQPSLTEHPFTDVEAGSWYEAPVLWALENGITTGATADTFNPVGQCQRAQVVTFLYRTAQLPPPPAVYDLQWNINGFTDTPSEYGTVTLSHTSAQAGETITATVIPAEGYQLDWAKCYFDTPVTQISETEYTFVMPDHEEIFCVNFSEIPVEPTEPDPTEPDPTDPTEPEVPVKTYTLDLRDNGNGKVAYVDGKTSAAPGESIFFYAVPNPGYELTNVGIFTPNGEIDVSKIQLFEHGNDLYELVMIDHDIIMTCHFTPIA